jgi:hypothetical protein
MPTQLKVDPKKAAAEAKKKAEEVKKKLTDNQVAKTATDLFAKIKEKTGASSKKVEQWQQTWLAMPKTRKKYEHLTDAPEIVGEELLGITNDIINFIQGQEGGDSAIFKKIKGEVHEMTHHPINYFKGKWEKGKSTVQSITGKAKAGMEKAKDISEKTKSGVAKAKESAVKAKNMAGKAKAVAKKAKSVAKKVKK